MDDQIRYDPHEYRTCVKCKHRWRYDPSSPSFKHSMSYKCPSCGSLAAAAGRGRRSFRTRPSSSGWTVVWGTWGLVATGLSLALLLSGPTSEGAVVVAIGVVWGLLAVGLWTLMQQAKARQAERQAQDQARAEKRMQRVSDRLEQDG